MSIMTTALKEKYRSEVIPKLGEALGIKNPLKMPKLSKVVVNMGVGIVEKDTLQAAVTDLAAISGQKPIIVKARKSVANFKLREGQPVGTKVTLRGDRMYEFLDRLINAALPRIRDFRGVSRKSFDGRGNYSLGLKEQAVFPEIDPNKASLQGMDITIVTTTKDDQSALALLEMFGMPFAEKKSEETGIG